LSASYVPSGQVKASEGLRPSGGKEGAQESTLSQGIERLKGVEDLASKTKNLYESFTSKKPEKEYRGGIVPRNGYATKGSVNDINGDVSTSPEQLQVEQEVPKALPLPTGALTSAKELTPSAAPGQQKTGASQLSDILSGVGSIGQGIGGLATAAKGLGGLFSGAAPTTAPAYGVVGAAGDLAVPTIGTAADAAAGSGILSTLASFIPEGLAMFSDERLKTAMNSGGVVPRRGYATDGAVDDIFERGVLGAESGHRQFDEEGRPLRSSKGAAGIAQVMPGTAPEAAKLAGLPYDENRYLTDEKYNAALGRAYFNEKMREFGGDEEKALAAYNAGAGRVRQAIARAEKAGGDYKDFLPAETRAYIPSVYKHAGATQEGVGAALKNMTPEQREFVATSREAPVSGGVAPSEETQGISGFLRGKHAADTGEKALDFLTSEKFLVPALSGLAGMASSKSRYLGPAILEGLGAGAQSYMQVPKTAAETQEILARAKEAGARTGKVGAETRGIDIENFQKSIKDTPYGRVVFLANGLPINMSEYRARVERGERVPLLGGLPADAEQRAAEAFKEPGAGMGTAPTTGERELPPEGETVPSTQPARVPPKTSVKTPEVAPTVAPGVAYDDTSRARARREQDVVMNGGPQAELAKARSEKYNDMVTNEANGARENSPYMKELSTTLADAYTKGGFDTPGFKSELRSDVISAANTFYHALGGEGDLGTLKRDQDIVNKISTLLSSERARAGNQHAYAALETMKNAIPNLSMDPRAGAELTAQLMVLQQRALDRDEHMKAYAKDSNGYLSEAPNDFTAKSASRYQMESKIISDLMLHHAPELKMMMSGHGVTPENIEEAIHTWYGKDAPKDMYRYFAPQR